MTPPFRAHHLFPVFCLGITSAAFYPGHLSFDSSFQFWQVRTGEYYNLSPAAMTYFWSLIHGMWPGSGGVFLLHMLFYWIGMWLIVCELYSRPLFRVAATLFAAAISPALLILTHLWTDAALIGSLTLASALILHAGRKRKRTPLYGAIPLLVYGGLVRHNALPALIPLLTMWLVVFARTGPSPQVLRARTLVAGVFIAVLATFAAGRALDGWLVVHRASTFGVVQIWDLAAISLTEGTMLVPSFVGPPDLTLDNLRGKYSPYTNVPLYDPPFAMRNGMDLPFSPDESRQLWNAWFIGISQHPVAYIKHRAAVTKALFGRYRNDRPRELAFVPEVVPYRDNPEILQNDSRLHRAAISWYARAIGWWIFAPAIYIVSATVCALLAWHRRRRVHGLFALATAVSGLLYVVPLPWVAPSAELRYSGWLFAATTISLLALLSRSPVVNLTAGNDSRNTHSANI